MIIKQPIRRKFSGKLKSVGKNAKIAYPDYTQWFEKSAGGTGVILFLEYSPWIGKLVETMAENACLILECLSWLFRIYSKRKMIGFAFDVETLYCYGYDLSKFCKSVSGWPSYINIATYFSKFVIVKYFQGEQDVLQKAKCLARKKLFVTQPIRRVFRMSPCQWSERELLRHLRQIIKNAFFVWLRTNDYQNGNVKLYNCLL